MITEFCIPPDFLASPEDAPQSEIDAAVERFNATADQIIARLDSFNAFLDLKLAMMGEKG